MGWNVAIATVVIVGIVAIVLTRSGSSDNISNAHPLAANQTTGVAGDHWHTYLGVNICGEWLNPAPAFEKAFESQSALANAGIHSHGDGLIHTHPFVTSEQGANATLGHYLSNGGWSVSSDSFDNSGGYTWAGPSGDPNYRSWSNGDTCTFGDVQGPEGRAGLVGRRQDPEGQPVRLQAPGRRHDRHRLPAQGCRARLPAAGV